MPLLDVSFMTTDPMLSDLFDVRRRVNAVGSNGRLLATGDELFRDRRGVVTLDGTSALARTEDLQSAPKRIFVAARFQFIAQSADYQPDEITWNGVVYTVESSLPYSRFGAGFYQAVAEARRAVAPLQ